MIDPIDAIEIPGKILVAIRTIETLIKQFKDADAELRRLTNKLGLLQTEFELLQAWAKEAPFISKDVAREIERAVVESIGFIADLQEKIQKVTPKDTAKRLSLWGKCGFMWVGDELEGLQKRVDDHFKAINRLVLLVETTKPSPPSTLLSPTGKARRFFKPFWRRTTETNSQLEAAGAELQSPILPITPGPDCRDTTYSSKNKLLQVPNDGTSHDAEKQGSPRSSFGNERVRRPMMNRNPSSPSLALFVKAHMSSEMKLRMTRLAGACANGKIEVVRHLIDEGVYLEGAHGVAPLPLVNAVQSQQNSHEMVLLLLESGAKVNVRDSKGNTPISYAVKRSNLQTTELLLKAGAEVNTADSAYSSGRGDIALTPLCYASWTGNIEIAELLIEHGAEVNSTSSKAYISAEQGLGAMEQVLGAGMASHLSPLHFAASSGSTAMVELLVSHKAKVTPFCEHLKEGQTEEKTGEISDRERRRTSRITPLHLANRTAGQELIKHGAKASAVDSKGRQLIHWAATSRRPDAVGLALSEHDEKDPKDEKGQTPLALFFKRLGKEDQWMCAGPLDGNARVDDTVSTLRELLMANSNPLAVKSYFEKPCPLRPKRHKGEWTWYDQITSLSP